MYNHCYIFTHDSRRMSVIDANDNAPRFLSEKFEGYINETARIGTVVLQVMARDDDVGNNGLVSINYPMFYWPYAGLLAVSNSCDPRRKIILLSSCYLPR